MRKFPLTIALFTVAALAAFTSVASAADRDQTNVSISHVFRSSEIIGMPVQNKNGENVGSINDLVIDMKSGEVRYAALSYGGIAGIGSKLFAVPFSAMTFVFGDTNKANARHFVFDVTKEKLEATDGFDSSHWPNVGDEKWAASIDKHYNVQRKEHVKTGEDAPKIAYETVFRASQINGMDVRNNKNENLGSVDELVIDVTKGHVKYVALSFGSWFTGGNKLFAMPLTAFTLNHANDKTFLVTNVSQEHLRNAQGFDKNHWPNTADPNWAKGIDTYYERTAQRPATRQ